MSSRTFIRTGPPAFCRGGGRFGHGGAPSRGAHFFPPAPFHHRGPPGFFNPGEFMPLFRLLDDAIRPEVFGPPREHHHHPRHHRGHGFGWPWTELGLADQESFNPNFDVMETEGAYELRGELPGVSPENIEVAFTDAQTLVVKGHTERETRHGDATTENQAAAAIEQQPTQDQQAIAENDAASDAGSTFSASSYQKPTVEDEEVATQATPAPTTATENVQAESSADAQQAVANNSSEQQQAQQPAERYWYSERSTGSFERTFNFPARVDQDGVTASLKNGILTLTVPKAQTQTRRINVL